MNYCICCSKVLLEKINFTQARVAQMDSNKYVYFCDNCGAKIDGGYYEIPSPNKSLDTDPEK